MHETQFQPDATYYTVPEALTLFIPNLVWNEVRRTRNQLLYGGQGTGKTMLLKRLSWPAMLDRPEFLESSPFIGCYCDMRDLAILKPLFSKPVSPPPIESPEAFRIASLLSSVHILDCLTKTFIESAGKTASLAYLHFEEALHEVASKFTFALGLGEISGQM